MPISDGWSRAHHEGNVSSPYPTPGCGGGGGKTPASAGSPRRVRWAFGQWSEVHTLGRDSGSRLVSLELAQPRLHRRTGQAGEPRNYS